MGCPILLNYGDFPVGIAAAYGSDLTAKQLKLLSLLTFLVPQRQRSTPSIQGTDTIVALHQ
jgi:hypothetical protein